MPAADCNYRARQRQSQRKAAVEAISVSTREQSQPRQVHKSESASYHVSILAILSCVFWILAWNSLDMQQAVDMLDLHREKGIDSNTILSNIDPWILRILQQAGYRLDGSSFFTESVLQGLPTQQNVRDLYGSSPQILGVDDANCQAYQSRSSGTIGVAGLFNSGTNLLYELLALNCWHPSDTIRNGNSNWIHWQVPWGKHVPWSLRGKEQQEQETAVSTLPIVTIRDPMTWMQSMCRQSYAVQFNHFSSLCPNLVPYPEDIAAHPRYAKKKYVPVHVRYSQSKNETETISMEYASLAHLWNDWYRDYYSVVNISTSSPQVGRIMVRLEDLIFRGEQVIPKVCKCLGGKPMQPYLPYRRLANENPGIDRQEGGLLKAILKYGNRTRRQEGYSTLQWTAADTILDPELLQVFGYTLETRGS